MCFVGKSTRHWKKRAHLCTPVHTAKSGEFGIRTVTNRACTVLLFRALFIVCHESLHYVQWRGILLVIYFLGNLILILFLNLSIFWRGYFDFFFFTIFFFLQRYVCTLNIFARSRRKIVLISIYICLSACFPHLKARWFFPLFHFCLFSFNHG